MAMEDVVVQLSQALEREGNSRVVFGEPMKLDTKTVIPVAAVRLGAGAGGVRPDDGSSTLGKVFFGGGGGGALDIRPVGFIHEQDGRVLYTPIHLGARNRPLLTELTIGVSRVIDTLTELGQAVLRRRAAH